MDSNERERRREQQERNSRTTSDVVDSSTMFNDKHRRPSSTTTSRYSGCGLSDIMDKYQNQIRRIDQLERRIDDRTVQARRRICSIIEQVPNTRPSHLRLFLSHSYQPPAAIIQQQQHPVVPSETTATTTTTDPASTLLPPTRPVMKRVLPKPAVWTINIEGKLLIDWLDHASAATYDKRVNYDVPQNDDLSNVEEKDIPTPILFTKLFDKIKVTFQTTFYQPQKLAAQQAAAAASAVAAAAAAAAAASASVATGKKGGGSPKKKSRRSNTSTPIPENNTAVLASDAMMGGGNSDALVSVDPRSLYLSSKQTLTWTKDIALLADNNTTEDSNTGNTTAVVEKDMTITNTGNNDLKNNVATTATTSSSSTSSSVEMDLTTNDAHVLCIQYQEPQPPPLSAAGSGGLTVYSVIADIELYRRKNYTNFNNNNNPNNLDGAITQQQQQQIGGVGTGLGSFDEYRIISSKLAHAMFPHHDPETTDLLSGKKRKFDDIVEDNEMSVDVVDGQPTSGGTGSCWNFNPSAGGGGAGPASDSAPPPDQNEIHVPTSLSMKEISMGFFLYIRDRKLVDDHDKSIVVCDELLFDLFQREQFLFSELQDLLLEQKLIERVTTIQPVRITYILKKETAYELGMPFPEDDDNNALDPTLIQVDLDCTVPSVFPYRARELLRRIKRRELEYAAFRTKARNLLQTSSRSGSGGGGGTVTNPASAGGNSTSNKDSTTNVADQGEIIRRKIEEAVEQHPLTEDMIPVYLALGKAAPPNTEARTAAHLDARIAYLLGRLKERSVAALASWKLVDWLSNKGGGGGHTGDPPTRM